MAQVPEIRAARPADAGAMKACVTAAYRHYLERMHTPPGPMLDDYARVVAEHRAFVAEERDAIVGVLVLVVAGSAMLLDNVAVAPERRGTGLGRRLLQRAEVEARSAGYASLDLYTNECMTENIAMYAKNGYVETGRRTVRGYRRVYMRKVLP